MANWTIKSVGDSPRTWQNQQKQDMVSYRIAVETKDGSSQPPKGQKAYSNVELVQRATTAAPKAGDEIEGSIETREYESPKGSGTMKQDLKFKKPAGGAGRGGGGRAWKPRPDDAPVVFAMRQASIQRQHSQDMAVRVLELAGGDTSKVAALMEELGVPTAATVKKEDGDEEVRDLKLVDAFARDASAAGRKAWDYEKKNGEIAAALAEIGG